MEPPVPVREASLWLDGAGLHRIVIEDRGNGRAAELVHDSDRASAAHEAFARALVLAGPGAPPLRLDPGTRRAPLPAGEVDVSVELEDGARLLLGRLGPSGATSLYRLCPFELRYASDHGRLHPVPEAARSGTSSRSPTTDLHTHFAGCLDGESLLAIGAARGVRYPAALLEEAGVHVEAAGGAVPIGALPEGARARLARSLVVPRDRRVTFLDMERIYRLRGPVTKHADTFVDILRRAATDYAAMGITYVELSLGSLVEARVLRSIHAHVPAIEEETGVTLRFLLALSRHDDLEWDLDLLRRVETLAGSVYVAGIDVMGHETNSTRAFAAQLEAFAAWASRARPGFVMRVHAGESPSHPENARLAVETLRRYDVTPRIGHGLYGVDEGTVAAIVETGTFIELNLDSNVALNHLQSGRDLPLRGYVQAGARVVLGTDGYGISGARGERTARAALVAGLRPEDLEGPLREAEEAARSAAARRDAAASGARRTFVVPDDLEPVHFTREVAARRHEARAARLRALEERLAEVSVARLEREDLAMLAQGKLVVTVSGAWQHSWEAMTAEARAAAETLLAELAEALAPARDRVVLLTGGTRHGVEGRLGPLALAAGIPVVGVIVEETEPSALAPAVASHVVVVAPTLYEKGAALLDLTASLGGACLYIGGGQIVTDEILAAKNLGLPYAAWTGAGASGAHARERPAIGFTRGAEAAWFVLERGGPHRPAPHWFSGPNPTVDAVVVRERLGGGRELLLVRRDPDAPAFPGAWALPGGFVGTHAPRGDAWEPGAESDEAACVRELREEASLEVEASRLVRIGVFEGGGRDPRDGARSWSRTTVFATTLSAERARAAVAGGDDADDARWFPLEALPARLAFDHAELVARALEVLFARSRDGAP